MASVRELRFLDVKGADSRGVVGRCAGGGDKPMAKGGYSEIVDVAKLSSSSFSSAISSGIISVGRSLRFDPGLDGGSSVKKRRSDSGDIERFRLLLEEAALRLSSQAVDGLKLSSSRSRERPRSSSFDLW